MDKANCDIFTKLQNTRIKHTTWNLEKNFEHIVHFKETE